MDASELTAETAPADVSALHGRFRELREALTTQVIGQAALVERLLIALLADGHLLVEGAPGLAKTTAVKALATRVEANFQRVQFTPDLLPSDLTGTDIWRQQDGRFEFQPGPLFHNLLLADEINRAPAKVQSALLEAMGERQITVGGKTYALPQLFLVMATQNPIEQEGTYPLPEAQLDRFLFRLVVGSVNASVLERIIAERHHGDTPEPSYRMSAETLDGLFDVVNRIVLPRPVAAYIARVVAASHADAEEAPETVRTYVTYGASPRAAIAMAEASRGVALLAGRPSVGFEDVRAVAPHVLNHRLILNYKARFDKVATFKVVDDLLAAIDPAGLHLPDSVSL